MKILFLLVVGVLLSMTTMTAQPTVSFFEEFPDETTLDKLAQIDFDTRIYLTARNLSEFYDRDEEFRARNKHVKSVIYWPVLEKDERYWISPWSDSAALEVVFEEIRTRENRQNLEVLLDLEPSLNRSRLFDWEEFKANRQRIAAFVREGEDLNLTISTVEKSYIPDWLLEAVGLSFDPQEYGTRKIKMYYSSYRRRILPDAVVDKLYERKVRQYAKKNIRLGLGLIAPGIHDEEHRTTPENLQKEIEIASDYGLEEVIIFRLDGLNGDYLKALHAGLSR